MLVQLLVERDQNKCNAKIAGRNYEFVRNEQGHLVTEVIDQTHLEWVAQPAQTAFKVYRLPKLHGMVDNLVVENGKAIFDEQIVEAPKIAQDEMTTLEDFTEVEVPVEAPAPKPTKHKKQGKK
jgi:translation initiation factor 6 (eIF-6)